MADKLLDRLALILNQAENTDNEHERETFMNAAMSMAANAGVDLAMVRARTVDKQKLETPTTRQVTLGRPGQKGLKYFVNLIQYIATTSDVKLNIAHNSTYVNLFGFPTDIDLVEALYALLAVQMVDASDRYLKSGEYRKEIRSAYNRYGEYLGQKPVDGRIARATFCQSFASQIGTRLRAARAEAEQAAKRSHFMAADDAPDAPVSEDADTSMALVLVEKRAAVSDYYREKSTARGTYRGGRASSGYSALASGAGRAAGGRAQIGGQRALPGSKVAIG